VGTFRGRFAGQKKKGVKPDSKKNQRSLYSREEFRLEQERARDWRALEILSKEEGRRKIKEVKD